jgi:tetratricopeptide (TPR) repeat protein
VLFIRGAWIVGLIAKRQGKLAEALEFMKICNSSDKRNLQVLKELISLSFLTRAYPEALAYAELAKEVQPSQDWSIVYHQGLCYERLANLSLVIEACTKHCFD